MSNQQYVIYFINQSGYPGNVCVYQDAGNVGFTQGALEVLAWMVTGANPSVQVNFKWQTDYNFVWFDYHSPQTQQIIEANISTGNAVPLCWNQFGYNFQKVRATSAGLLSLQLDSSIPTINNTLAGIGMHGAGTFASNARPNIQSSYTPAVDGKLLYWIGFGAPFSLNEPIDLSALPIISQKIDFPPGVYAMTAILNAQNLWICYPGAPAAKDAASLGPAFDYEAGKGILTSNQK